MDLRPIWRPDKNADAYQARANNRPRGRKGHHHSRFQVQLHRRVPSHMLNPGLRGDRAMCIGLWSTRITAWALAAVLGFVGPSFAQGIRFKLPAGSEFQAAIARLPSDQQATVRQAVAEVFPLFIFIPGIMGSRLTKTLPDKKEKLIWGSFQGIFT